MSHFYTSDGTCIEGLRAARKLDPLPLPSPTTVLSLLMSPGLVHYFKRSMFEAAVTTPRPPGATDDEFFDLCTHWSEEHGKAARDKGGALHDLIQQFHLAVKHGAPPPTVPTQLAPQYGTYVDWFADNVERSLAIEEVVVSPSGYAGRVDHVAKLLDGRICVLDVKTQDISKRKSFNHYSNWALQLGAYADAWENGEIDSGRHVDALMSICISTGPKPILEAWQWPDRPCFYSGLFKGLLNIWSFENDYWPTSHGSRGVECRSEAGLVAAGSVVPMADPPLPIRTAQEVRV